MLGYRYERLEACRARIPRGESPSVMVDFWVMFMRRIKSPDVGAEAALG